MASEAKPSLGPALTSVLDKAPPALRDPMATFLGAAVEIIASMGEHDLPSVHVANDGTMDAVSAARVRAAVPVTATAVRAFLSSASHFAPQVPPADINPELAAAYELISNSGRILTGEVALFDKQVRHPSVTADLWQLMDVVASLRGKTRYAAGDMIYFLCRAFEDGRKEDFVPAYGHDVDNSVEVRRGVTELRQQVRICVSTMGAVPNDEVPIWVRKLSDSIKAFYQNNAYTCMRVADKRALIGHHQAMNGLLADPKSTTGQFVKCIDAVMLFFESLLAINRRALLIAHDKQLVMAAKEHLFNAIEGLLTSATQSALQELTLAAKCVHATFGRDTHLDNLLMAYRHLPNSVIPQGDLLGSAEALLAAVDRMAPF